MTETPENPEPAVTPEPATSPESATSPEPATNSETAVTDAAPAAFAAPSAPAAAPAPATEPAPAPAAAAEAASVGPSKPRRSATAGIVAGIVAAALIGGGAGAGVTLLATGNNGSSSTTTSASPQGVTVNDPDNATTITEVAAKASASVVTISVSSDSSGGTGSGVVLTEDGYVLTNTHVVTLDGQVSDPDVTVQTSDGHLYSAKIVGTDPVSDLAVIKVKDVTNLSPATFADSSKLNVGDTAIAIGAPLGLAGTVTNGIVSALNRSITIASSAAPEDTGTDGSTPSDPNTENPYDFWQFDVPGQDTTQPSTATISLAVIQTDAAINPGNSGGALLDSSGRVMGINVAIATASSSSSTASGSIGVGFAIPANLAKRIADEIIANGSATHGLLGASILDVTEDPENATSATVGASVKEVTAGGAADKAGIRAGDVITAFNGVTITGKTDLTAQVRFLPAGATAKVTYVRDGTSAETTVTLGSLQ